MHTAKPSVIFFDVMDTLVYNPFAKEEPAFFGITHAELLRRKNPTSWVQFESGRITEAEYFRQYFADGSRFEEDRFLRCIREAYRWVEGMEELISDLRTRGIPMHTLSNYPIWYRDIENKLRVSRYVEWTFVSCQTGVRKPSREAYLGAATTLGRRLETCLLIDDGEENCEGAEAVGMPAIAFRGAEVLRGELIRLGLL